MNDPEYPTHVLPGWAIVAAVGGILLAGSGVFLAAEMGNWRYSGFILGGLAAFLIGARAIRRL